MGGESRAVVERAVMQFLGQWYPWGALGDMQGKQSCGRIGLAIVGKYRETSQYGIKLVLGGVHVPCLGEGGGTGLLWGLSKAAEVTQTWTGLESLISKEQAVMVLSLCAGLGLRRWGGGPLRGICMKFAVLFRR